MLRPQTKLRKGSVFTGVCLSTGEGVGTLHASWERLHGRRTPLWDTLP